MLAGGTGGSTDARYCYAVWLRHLVMADSSGLEVDPASVAELGPGDSLGTGLCAVLTGASTYLALDVQAYANTSRNLAVLDDLVSLLTHQTPIPDEEEYPLVDPRLVSYRFPAHILTPARLARTLAPERIERIRAALQGRAADGLTIRYATPWQDPSVIQAGTMDVIVSQAVLEHVDDLPHAYAAMYQWLRPGGFTSACIDFRSHTYAREWNGHWGYGDRMWRVIRGNRRFLLNREPLSTHQRLLQATGFRIIHEQPRSQAPELPRARLASRFHHLTDRDLRTQTVFIQAAKPG